MNSRDFTAHILHPDKAGEMAFRFNDEKPSGNHEGGVYLDENNQRWLMKFISPTDAVREVVASQLYRLLVGENEAPEVQLFKQTSPDRWIVASKWCDKLNEFNNTASGIEKMFLASLIIGDVDCVEKNIAEKNGNIFRYDFGAALRLNQNKQNELSEAACIYEIIKATGFNPLHIIDQLNSYHLCQSVSELATDLLMDFDWNFWEKCFKQAVVQDKYIDSNESLLTQCDYVNDRIKMVKEKAARQNSQVIINDNDLISDLVSFYQSISSIVKPLFSDYDRHMTKQHLNHMQTEGNHPDFFNSLLAQANTTIEMNESSLLFGMNLVSSQDLSFSEKIIEASLSGFILKSQLEDLLEDLSLEKILKTSRPITQFSFFSENYTLQGYLVNLIESDLSGMMKAQRIIRHLKNHHWQNIQNELATPQNRYDITETTGSKIWRSLADLIPKDNNRLRLLSFKNNNM